MVRVSVRVLCGRGAAASRPAGRSVPMPTARHAGLPVRNRKNFDPVWAVCAARPGESERARHASPATPRPASAAPLASAAWQGLVGLHHIAIPLMLEQLQTPSQRKKLAGRSQASGSSQAPVEMHYSGSRNKSRPRLGRVCCRSAGPAGRRRAAASALGGSYSGGSRLWTHQRLLCLSLPGRGRATRRLCVASLRDSMNAEPAADDQPVSRLLSVSPLKRFPSPRRAGSHSRPCCRQLSS